MPGFPIRTSSDLSSVGSSPRLIAASHVLHRLLMPRHPPCALNNLATKIKMLASTVQFSKYGRDLPPNPPRPHTQTITIQAQAVRCDDTPAARATPSQERLFPQDPT